MARTLAPPQPFAMLSRTLLNDDSLFSQKQHNAILGISVSFGAVSFVLSLLMLLSYYKYKRLRNPASLLVMQLAISEIGADISYFLGDPEDGSGVCTFQGFLQQLSQLATILWATLIAVNIYRRVVLLEKDLAFWKFGLVGYGLPVVLALLPLTTGSYGQVGGKCWVVATANDEFDVGTMWRFLSFYAVLWVCIVLDVALMWKVRGYLKHTVASQGGDATKGARKVEAAITRLKYFPLILIICWTPATINRIHNSAHPTSPIFVLSVLQVLFRSCQGIANAVTHGLSGPVRATWMQSLQEHAPSVYAAFASLGFDIEVPEEDEEGGRGGGRGGGGGDGDAGGGGDGGGGGGGGALADKMDAAVLTANSEESKHVETEMAVLDKQDP